MSKTIEEFRTINDVLEFVIDREAKSLAVRILYSCLIYTWQKGDAE